MTERDERVLEWLRMVRMVEMPALRWVLGGFSGAGAPVSLRKAQQWVARCREAGLVGSARPSFQAGSIVWATFAVTGRPAPNLLRQTVRHDLAVAAVGARYVCAGWSWSTDREPERGQHQADGYATRGAAHELIEVELTSKTRSRYPAIFRSHDERMRFDGISSIVYVTDERTRGTVEREIRDRVFHADQQRFEIIAALDVWGRLTDERWPDGSPRFSQPTSSTPEAPPLSPPSSLF